MKNLLVILLPICLVWNTKSIGQNSTGAIVYEGFVNKAYVDSFTQAFNSRKDVNMSMKQRISNYYDYNNTVSDEFILLFDGTESNYKYISPLASQNGDILGSLANKNLYYVNNESKIIIEKSRPLGSISHKYLEWKITKETKTIGTYECYKAVASERLYSRQGFYYNKQVIA